MPASQFSPWLFYPFLMRASRARGGTTALTGSNDIRVPSALRGGAVHTLAVFPLMASQSSLGQSR